jgi:predicted O-methyltransferase YrrM
LRENSHGRLYAIDPHRATDWNDQGAIDSLPALKENLRWCGVERYVAIVRTTSVEAAANWRHPIDLLFIDGDHSYAGVKSDWELFSPHLTPFAFAIFHDTTWELNGAPKSEMGVPRFLEELRHDGYPVLTINQDCGLSLVQARRGGFSLASISP